MIPAWSSAKNTASRKHVSASSSPSADISTSAALLKLQQVEDHLQNERWEKALSLLKGLTPPQNDPCLSAEIFYQRGEACRLGSLYSNALAAYRKSASLYKKIHDIPHYCASLLGAAGCLRHIENFSEANRYYQEALSPGGERDFVNTHRESKMIRADALCGLGLSLKGEGKPREAREYLEKSLKIYGVLKDEAGIAHNKWALGVVHRTAGRLAEAKNALLDAVAAYEKMGDSGGLAYSSCALGGTLRVSGYAEASFELYRKAHALFKKLNDPYGVAYGLCGMANAERAQGKTSGALARYRQAERLYRRLNQRTPLAFTLWGIAGVQRISGRPKAAAGQYKKAKALFQRARDERGALYADLGMGLTCLQAGDKSKARSLFKSTLSKAEKLGLPLEACHAQLGLLKSLDNPAGFLADALAKTPGERSPEAWRSLAQRYKSFGASPEPLMYQYKDIP